MANQSKSRILRSNKNMDTIICDTPGKLRLFQSEAPKLNQEAALLKIHQVGICGTDIHAFEGTQPYFTYPRILGHELAAEILQIPDGSGFAVGDLVTVKPYFHCGTCIACKQGKTNCCTQLQVYGVHIDGGMRSRIALPISSLIAGHGLNIDQLSLVEPLAIGAHGIRRAAIRPGEDVLVVGTGPIGIGTLLLAQAAGARLIAMDINTERLAYCRTLITDLMTVDANGEDPEQRIREYTDGDMPSVVIDCTGSQQAINGAFRYMAHGGRFVLIGLQQQPITFSHPEFHKREATLMSSRNATSEDFNHVIGLLRQGTIRSSAFITHRISHERLPDVFGSLLDPAYQPIKAVVTFS